MRLTPEYEILHDLGWPDELGHFALGMSDPKKSEASRSYLCALLEEVGNEDESNEIDYDTGLTIGQFHIRTSDLLRAKIIPVVHSKNEETNSHLGLTSEMFHSKIRHPNDVEITRPALLIRSDVELNQTTGLSNLEPDDNMSMILNLSSAASKIIIRNNYFNRVVAQAVFEIINKRAVIHDWRDMFKPTIRQ